MKLNLLKTLKGKWRGTNLPTVHACHDRIAALEQLLGIEPSDFIHNITVANTRIRQLEALVAKMPALARAAAPLSLPNTPSGAPAVAAVSTPARGRAKGAAGAPSLTAPLPPVPPAISRAVLLQLASVFPVVEASPDDEDSELLARIEQAAYTAHLRFPGMRPDEELAKVYDRKDAATFVHGLARTLRAMRQSRISMIFGAGTAPPGHAKFPAPERTAGAVAAPVAVLIHTAAGRPTRAQLSNIAAVLNVDLPKSMPDDQAFDYVEALCFRRCHRFPGMRAEQVLAAEYIRPDPDKIIGSEGTVLHAMQREKLKAICEPK